MISYLGREVDLDGLDANISEVGKPYRGYLVCEIIWKEIVSARPLAFNISERSSEAVKLQSTGDLFARAPRVVLL